MTAALRHRLGIAHPERACRLSRRHVGVLVTLAGALLLLHQLATALATMATNPTVAAALQGGMVAAIATAAGAFPVLLARRLRTYP